MTPKVRIPTAALSSPCATSRRYASLAPWHGGRWTRSRGRTIVTVAGSGASRIRGCLHAGSMPTRDCHTNARRPFGQLPLTRRWQEGMRAVEGKDRRRVCRPLDHQPAAAAPESDGASTLKQWRAAAATLACTATDNSAHASRRIAIRCCRLRRINSLMSVTKPN